MAAKRNYKSSRVVTPPQSNATESSAPSAPPSEATTENSSSTPSELPPESVDPLSYRPPAADTSTPTPPPSATGGNQSSKKSNPTSPCPRTSPPPPQESPSDQDVTFADVTTTTIGTVPADGEIPPPPPRVPGSGTRSTPHIEWAAQYLPKEQFRELYHRDAARLIRTKTDLSDLAIERLRSLL